jgi:hypothetical protein
MHRGIVRLLGMMLVAAGAAQGVFMAADPEYGRYGALLSRYVTVDGVRYAAWRGSTKDLRELQDVVARIAAIDPDGLSAPERYALYINLYNAKTLETVLDGDPPGSIKDLSSGLNPYEIFKRKTLEFDGVTASLNDVETRLRDESNDPRIHFAVNCASRSCPPIAPEPYRGATLDAQLDRTTRAFLATPGAVEIAAGKSLLGGKVLRVTVSKIFDWYAKDFAAAGGSLAFVEKYAPGELARAIGDAGETARLRYHDYDWSLNAAP